ncbi:MAG: alpha/beta fold hydrolase [Streptosporangiaceae bacterium]
MADAQGHYEFHAPNIAPGKAQVFVGNNPPTTVEVPGGPFKGPSRPVPPPAIAIAGAANTMRLAADDVQSVVIPGCGHYCLEEAPQEILATLTAFPTPYRG